MDGNHRAPTGAVTFAFSDVEGSTRLWAEHPEAMRVSLSLHDEALEAVSLEWGGYVFSRAGDSFGVAFDRPAGAVAWALAVQQQIAAVDWPAGAEIRVRIGMHTGEADERSGDYFGSAVNLAARIEAAGKGGQILVSDVTASLVDRDDLVELGSFRLKDVVVLQPIFQIGAEPHPQLRTLDSRGGNLPRQLTGLIGREEELAHIDAMLETAVLMTLVGPGGIGKTRLALEAARRAEPTIGGAVWVLELAVIGSGEDVARVATQVLGVRETGASPLVEQVAAPPSNGTGRYVRRWRGRSTCWSPTSGCCLFGSAFSLAASTWRRRRRSPLITSSTSLTSICFLGRWSTGQW